MNATVSIEDRYKAAITDVRLNSDVLVFDNFPTCCGSCAGYEIEQTHADAPYVYFINQQGRGLTWKDGKPYNYEMDYVPGEGYDDDDEEITVTTPATKVWFSHSNLHAATVLRDALVKFGLTVEWDGTDMKCVTLDFTE